MDFSFVIVSNGKKQEITDLVLKSIHCQQIDSYEILIAGDYPKGEGYTLVSAKSAAKKGLLGEMRNRACEASEGEKIVILDDDMILSPDWYKNLLNYKSDYDILTSQVRLPDGTRFWDHVCYQSPKYGHCVLNENEDDPYLYMSGGQAWIMKRYVFEKCKWNTEYSTGLQRANMKSLKDYEEGKHNEDTDFSQKCRDSGFKISHNHQMLAFHNDDQYTCVGRLVRIRQQEKSRFWVNKLNFYRPAEEIGEYAKHLWNEGNQADAADVIRYGLQFHFQNFHLNQIWKFMVDKNGGELTDDNWRLEGDERYLATMDFLNKVRLNFV
tara:strand:+ start:25017 stop:25988 length:972 start_codon:yes stop_codon:yes gene_type:complete